VIEVVGFTQLAPPAHGLATAVARDAPAASVRGVAPPVVNWVDVMVRFQPSATPVRVSCTVSGRV
jgi:hypothetical protein